jgi:hypothetical protein
MKIQETLDSKTDNNDCSFNLKTVFRKTGRIESGVDYVSIRRDLKNTSIEDVQFERIDSPRESLNDRQ